MVNFASVMWLFFGNLTLTPPPHFFFKGQASYPPLQLHLCKKWHPWPHCLRTNRSVRGNKSLHCSLLLSLKRQTLSNHNKVITPEHCLHGDREWQHATSPSVNTCRRFWADAGKMESLSWLIPVLPPSHTEMVKLSTFLSKCFYPGRQYFTHHEAFWTHSSEAAEAVRFAGNTMGMPPVIPHAFLIYLQLFFISYSLLN